jgi:hypothetical protein
MSEALGGVADGSEGSASAMLWVATLSPSWSPARSSGSLVSSSLELEPEVARGRNVAGKVGLRGLEAVSRAVATRAWRKVEPTFSHSDTLQRMPSARITPEVLSREKGGREKKRRAAEEAAQFKEMERESHGEEQRERETGSACGRFVLRASLQTACRLRVCVNRVQHN